MYIYIYTHTHTYIYIYIYNIYIYIYIYIYIIYININKYITFFRSADFYIWLYLSKYPGKECINLSMGGRNSPLNKKLMGIDITGAMLMFEQEEALEHQRTTVRSVMPHATKDTWLHHWIHIPWPSKSQPLILQKESLVAQTVEMSNITCITVTWTGRKMVLLRYRASTALSIRTSLEEIKCDAAVVTSTLSL